MSAAIYGLEPEPDECSFVGTYTPADAGAAPIEHYARRPVRLAADRLWLGHDLCIPLENLRSWKVFKVSGLVSRYGLKIVFINSTSNAVDVVYLADMTWIGLFRREPLDKLCKALDAAVQCFKPALDAEGYVSSESDAPFTPEPPHQRSFLGVWFETIRDLIQSQDQLRMRTYIDWIGQLSPVEIPRGTTLDQAHACLLHLLKKADKTHRDLHEQVRVLALARRVTAAWNFIWIMLLPGLILAFWLGRELVQQPTPSRIAIALVLAAVFYGLVVAILSVVAAHFFPRYVAWANRRYGLDIKILPARRF